MSQRGDADQGADVMDEPAALKIAVDETLFTRIDIALRREDEGDPWPMAILNFRVGNRGALVALIKERGLEAGTEQANLACDALEGKFRTTRRDTTVLSEHHTLHLVMILKQGVDALRADSSVMLPDGAPRTMEEVYARVAEGPGTYPCKSADAVRKTWERHLRRASAASKGP